MEDNYKVKVKNRSHSPVVYRIDDMNLRREFAGLEEKMIDFEELRRLSYRSGGLILLQDYLVVKDKEALEALNIGVEPEYFYEQDEVDRLLKQGSMDQFLDCLDFAPDGVIDLIKERAVALPLNDVAKRQVLKNKFDYDVNKIMEIRQATMEGNEQQKEKRNTQRRAAVPSQGISNSSETGKTGARRVVIKEG